jgi:hypothetical protein
MATIGSMMNRRDLLRLSMMGTVAGIVGMGSPAIPALATDDEDQQSAQISGPERAVGKIFELQAAFHRAKTTQNIDLMMSLWAEGATLQVQGDSNSPYVGRSRLTAFWQNSGSFTHRRFSLVPSFKTRINADGNTGFLYFECHDIGDFDLSTRFIAGDTFLAGAVRRQEDRWVFWNMTAGKASPLSIDHDYFP